MDLRLTAAILGALAALLALVSVASHQSRAESLEDEARSLMRMFITDSSRANSEEKGAGCLTAVALVLLLLAIAAFIASISVQ